MLCGNYFVVSVWRQLCFDKCFVASVALQAFRGTCFGQAFFGKCFVAMVLWQVFYGKCLVDNVS